MKTIQIILVLAIGLFAASCGNSTTESSMTDSSSSMSVTPSYPANYRNLYYSNNYT